MPNQFWDETDDARSTAVVLATRSGIRSQVTPDSIDII